MHLRLSFTIALSARLLGVTASPLPHVQHPNRQVDARLFIPQTYAKIASWIKATNIPGLVIALTTPEGDGILPFGVAYKAGNPITEEESPSHAPFTYFPIASNTKLITAITINLLAEQCVQMENGETFSLNSKMEDVIPDFQMWNANSTQEATVFDFLTHQSGIPTWVANIRPGLDPEGWSEELRYWKTSLEVREGYQYSNLNYAILSYAIEQLTGKSYYDVVQELIFDPLGLEATYNATEAKERGSRSQGFLQQGINRTACDMALRTLQSTNTTDTLGVAAPPSCLGRNEAFDFWTDGDGMEWSGGSSAIFRGRDMLAWAREMVNPQVIPWHIVEQVQRGVVRTWIGDDMLGPGLYGQGSIAQTYRDYNVSVHLGAFPGALSLFARVPNETIGIFIACNDGLYGYGFNIAVVKTILDELLGLRPIDWVPQVLGLGPFPVNATDVSLSESSTGAILQPGSPRPAPEGYVDQTFRAPGFSDFTLRQLYLNDTTSIEEAAFPLNYILTDYVTSGGTFLTSGPAYYAYWGQSIADRLIFTHFDGPLFNMTSLKVWERVPGEVEVQQIPVNGSQYVAYSFAAAPAVFAEGGIGLFGSFWSSVAIPGISVDISETDVEAKAIAFFGRVEEEGVM